MVSSGNICHFEDMQVKSALLDEIMKDPENPTEDLVVELDIKVCSLNSSARRIADHNNPLSLILRA